VGVYDAHMPHVWEYCAYFEIWGAISVGNANMAMLG
jgi:hypothetical protein